ncbi:MAG TPA: hypothetical protein VF942_02700 [Acidimicrobiales bacterium]|nr:hypothetical protein [Actinomycetota bacterium]
MKVRKWAVGALVGGMLMVGPAAAFADGGGPLGGINLGGLLGGDGNGNLLGNGCGDGELVSVAGGAGLVGVNLGGLEGLNLSNGLLGHDDGQLLGIGGQNGDDAGNALITTGEADLSNGLIGIALSNC